MGGAPGGGLQFRGQRRQFCLPVGVGGSEAQALLILHQRLRRPAHQVVHRLPADRLALSDLTQREVFQVVGPHQFLLALRQQGAVEIEEQRDACHVFQAGHLRGARATHAPDYTQGAQEVSRKRS